MRYQPFGPSGTLYTQVKMKKSNLYAIEVITTSYSPQRSVNKRIIHVAARNVKNAFIKASRCLEGFPSGKSSTMWKLTGNYTFIGKVFM
jgi:hypothetical protein